MTNQAIYKGSDICKLIAACFIVLLHAIETLDYTFCGIKFVCTRFAVPFFFITSGFFFAKGICTAQSSKIYVRNYLLNLAKIFGIWALVIYGPFTIYSYFNLPQYQGADFGYMAMVLFRKLFIVGPGPYWYLVALFEAIVVIYFIRRKPKIIIAMMCICFSLLFTYTSCRESVSQLYFINAIFQFIDFLYSWEFNFIMYGIPFCSIGYLIYKFNASLDKKVALGLFALFTILRIPEYVADVPLSLYIPQAVFFFFFSISFKPNISDNLSRSFRQLSSFVYFSHAIILYNILNVLLVNAGVAFVYSPIFVFQKTIFVILICTLIYVVLKKQNNRLCKLLING